MNDWFTCDTGLQRRPDFAWPPWRTRSGRGRALWACSTPVRLQSPGGKRHFLVRSPSAQPLPLRNQTSVSIMRPHSPPLTSSFSETTSPSVHNNIIALHHHLHFLKSCWASCTWNSNKVREPERVDALFLCTHRFGKRDLQLDLPTSHLRRRASCLLAPRGSRERLPWPDDQAHLSPKRNVCLSSVAKIGLFSTFTIISNTHKGPWVLGLKDVL